MRSFYMLELSVLPGGARKADYYLFSSIEEVRRALEDDLSDPIGGAYLVLWYGETINLRVYIEGRAVWEKDLHSSITFHVPGYPPLRGTVDGLVLDYSPSSREEYEENLERVRRELSDLLWSESEQLSAYRVEIDWAALEIPALEGQRLEPGEVVNCMLPDADEEEFEYGYNSLE